MNIEARINRLESQNRRLKVGATILCLSAFTLGAGTGEDPVHENLNVRQITMINEVGEGVGAIAAFGEDCVFMGTKYAAYEPGDLSAFELNNGVGVPPHPLVLMEAGESLGLLSISNPDGDPLLQLGADHEAGSALLLNDLTGMKRYAIGPDLLKGEWVARRFDEDGAVIND